MAQLFSKSSYFSTRSALKSRETELQQALRTKLPTSNVADELFEYLAVRVENERTKLGKELNPESVGRLKELSTLLDMFSPVKTSE